MTSKVVVPVKDNQVVISLPEAFSGKKEVLISVDILKDARKQKLELLKEAANDPLFLEDAKSVQEDFKDADLNM